MIGKKLINHSLIYGLSSLLINGSNFFLIPFYTHYLTTSEYGIISSVTLFTTITTTFLTLGLNSATTRFYVEYNQEQFKSFLFSVFVFQIGVSVFIVGVFVAFDGLFLDHIFNNVTYHPYLEYGMYAGLAAVFSTIPLAYLQAQSKALFYRLFTTSSFILLTFFMVWLVVARNEGSMGGVKAPFYANLIMSLFYLVFIIRQTDATFIKSYISIALAYSFPLMIYSIFGAFMDVSSKFFVERLTSLSQLGIYNVAQQISSVILLLTNAINMAWVPLFFKEAKQNPDSQLFANFGKLLIFFLTFSGMVLSMFCGELLGFLIPGSYQSTVIYIPWLVLTYIIGGGYWILIINPITFARKTIYLPFLTVLSSVFSIGLNLALIPLLGTVGAAVSMLLGHGILVFAAYLIYNKFSSVKYDFYKMNMIVVIGIVVYCISLLIQFESLIMNVIIKSGLVLMFLLLVKFLKFYSILEIRIFIKSQFS